MLKKQFANQNGVKLIDNAKSSEDIVFEKYENLNDFD